MRESLDEPVSVVWYYNASQRRSVPHLLSWAGRDYKLGKIDFYHKTKHGDTTIHHYSLCDTESTVYFKIACNADTLQWTVEEFMYAGEVALTHA
jgi:hypothetical protein